MHPSPLETNNINCLVCYIQFATPTQIDNVVGFAFLLKMCKLYRNPAPGILK